MQKVIIINLNGHPYHLEEGGYDALRAYLETAERDLAGNPDRAEIMADLEQAIADKCQRFLGPRKSVVTSGEVDQIVAEMGPVDASAGAAPGDGTGADDAPPGTGAASKRLFRVPEGQMIAGVCTGLAAYFSVDVTIMRIAFVLAALFTEGAAIVAYIIMMFVVPEAKTPEQRAAAGTAPFNARDVVDRAKKEYARNARRMRHQWRRQQRHWRRYAGAHGVVFAYGPPSSAAAVLPLLTLVHFALFAMLVVMAISLVNTGEIFGWDPPPGVPLWASLLILLVGYQIVVAPIRAAEQWSQAQPGPWAFWNAVIWLIGLAFALWLASNHIPEIRDFLQELPHVFRDFMHAIREALRR